MFKGCSIHLLKSEILLCGFKKSGTTYPHLPDLSLLWKVEGTEAKPRRVCDNLREDWVVTVIDTVKSSFKEGWDFIGERIHISVKKTMLADAVPEKNVYEDQITLFLCVY